MVTHAIRWLDHLPWVVVLAACLTLGLAPFVPEPHVWEKLQMLVAGTLTRPIDIFDLLMHGSPFFVAALKLTLVPSRRRFLPDGSNDLKGKDGAS